LKFDIFLITFVEKCFSLCFELVKWNFTTAGPPPGKMLLVTIRKNKLLPPPPHGKNSSCAHGWCWITALFDVAKINWFSFLFQAFLLDLKE